MCWKYTQKKQNIQKQENIKKQKTTKNMCWEKSYVMGALHPRIRRLPFVILRGGGFERIQIFREDSSLKPRTVLRVWRDFLVYPQKCVPNVSLSQVADGIAVGSGSPILGRIRQPHPTQDLGRILGRIFQSQVGQINESWSKKVDSQTNRRFKWNPPRTVDTMVGSI